MWSRLRRWLSEGSGSSEEKPDTVVTLRNLEVARKFPQELPDLGVRLKTGEPHACTTCGAELRRVIITTGGPFGDKAVWEAYPLALDGWQCPQCQKLTYPADLSPAEITALLDQSIASARRGDLDQAELGFRRAISSWPTYMPARVNFGAMCLDRIRAEQLGPNRPEMVERYMQAAEAQLRKSLTCQPPAPVQARFMLGKLLYRTNRKDEGAALLDQLMQSADAPAPLREQARALLAEAK